MNIQRGGIYELDEKWNQNRNPVFVNRPVIVIKKGINSIDGVLMGILPNISDKENQVMIEYTISDTKFISAVACDIVHKIPIKYIKNHQGYIGDAALDSISTKIQEIQYELKSKKIYEDALNAFKDINTANVEKFEELANGVAALGENTSIIAIIEENTTNIKENTAIIKENTAISRELLEKVNKKINIWKERLIGFAFGILASLVASSIWEKLKYIDIINQLIKWIGG